MKFKCPLCDGTRREVRPLSPVTAPTECSWCKGAGELTQAELEAVAPMAGWKEQCCKLAVKLPRGCVCRVRTFCREHGGKRCHGSHG